MENLLELFIELVGLFLGQIIEPRLVARECWMFERGHLVMLDQFDLTRVQKRQDRS